MPSDWRIEYFKDERGEEPVRSWLLGLESRARARVFNALDRLTALNVAAHEPLVKKLTGTDVWEVRVEHATNAYRVLYVFVRERRIVLLHAFQKKTPKTPASAIEMAERRLKALREREGRGI